MTTTAPPPPPQELDEFGRIRRPANATSSRSAGTTTSRLDERSPPRHRSRSRSPRNRSRSPPRRRSRSPHSRDERRDDRRRSPPRRRASPPVDEFAAELERYQRERDSRNRPHEARRDNDRGGDRRRDYPSSNGSSARDDNHKTDTRDERAKDAREPPVVVVVPTVTEKLQTTTAAGDAVDGEGDDGEEFLVEKIDPEVLKMMGLPTEMHSTKGEHVVGADASYARAVKKRKYRQYMNRRLPQKPLGLGQAPPGR